MSEPEYIPYGLWPMPARIYQIVQDLEDDGAEDILVTDVSSGYLISFGTAAGTIGVMSVKKNGTVVDFANVPVVDGVAYGTVKDPEG